MKHIENMGAQQNNQLVENRSIDFIPEHERHGSILSQFTLWFGANLQITAIVTGALAVVLGGDVFWSIMGLIIGQAFGSTIMALHAAQGPKLGLPQMISSRVQFGVYGACIPIILVCLMYIGFTATGTVLSGQAIAKLLSVSNVTGILIFASIIIVLATLGYRVIHWIGKIASVFGIITFIIIFAQVMLITNLSDLIAIKHFNWSSFLLAVSLSASWQIAFGPYVADYSRYLPTNTSTSKVFWAVAAGSFMGSQISMTLGVFIAQIAQGGFVGKEVAYVVGLGSIGAVAAFFIPWSAINLIDYYFISREKCDINELSNPNGKYGRWNKVGIGCYIAGILFQLPFIDTKLYTGSIAKLMGGVDLSWISGLIFTAVVYFICAKLSADPANSSKSKVANSLSRH